jgi:hypothetical protein
MLQQENLLLALDDPAQGEGGTAPTAQARAAAEQQASAERKLRLSPEVLWLVRVLGTIAVANGRARRGPQGEQRHTGPATAPEPDRWPPPLGPEPAQQQARLIHLREVAQTAKELLSKVVSFDSKRGTLVYSVNLNRPAEATVSRSAVTVKADAATRLFDLNCRELSWAIVDSGVDATHPAFRQRDPDGKLPRLHDRQGRLRSRVLRFHTPSLPAQSG